MQEGILCCRSPVCADFRALVPTASTRSPIPNGATHAATTSSHGLTRNSRDFDALATSLADRYRIVCMDVVGRGSSDWLRHKGDYGFPLYLSDAAALLARITAPLPSTRLRRALYGSPRAIGPIPGELMLLGSILFIGGWITFAIVTLYLDRAKHGGKPIRVAMG